MSLPEPPKTENNKQIKLPQATKNNVLALDQIPKAWRRLSASAMGEMSATAKTGYALEDCPGKSEDEKRLWRIVMGVEEGRFKFVKTDPNPKGKSLSAKFGMFAQCTKCDLLVNYLDKNPNLVGGQKPSKKCLRRHLTV